ncbi:hypothetical protein [Photobacterium toruni]|uniref:hypothetical protein n=1 Tax=Photobacterium toruni TaxID=1935446 RepID=UPI0021103D21|nr:hypothetical protein [Photobacterium toruni]
MSLKDQLIEAIHDGRIAHPFTPDDFHNWMEVNFITQDDGSDYAKSSVNAFLSNSDRKQIPTSNKNKKFLSSGENDGVLFYAMNANLLDNINK